MYIANVVKSKNIVVRLDQKLFEQHIEPILQVLSSDQSKVPTGKQRRVSVYWMCVMAAARGEEWDSCNACKKAELSEQM